MNILILSPYPENLIAPILARGDDVTLRTGVVDAAEIERLRPDWIISYGYTRLIEPPVLALCEGRVLNLHISLLPHNRGADPNFWSWYNDTAKGVTLHLIDPGMDSGPILAQREIRFDPLAETLASSYARLRHEIEDLFAHSWADIAGGRLEAKVQTTRFPVNRVAHKAELFASLPAGWQTRACIVKRLRDVPDQGSHKLGMDQSCPCPLGPCELAPAAQTPH